MKDEAGRLSRKQFASGGATGDKPHGLALKPGVDFAAELRKAGIEFQERSGDLGIYFDCHGINGQPCYVAGRIHDSHSHEPKQMSFVLTDKNQVLATCFHNDCHGDPRGDYTRRALKTGGLEHILTEGKTVLLSLQWGDETTEDLNTSYETQHVLVRNLNWRRHAQRIMPWHVLGRENRSFHS